MASATKKLFPIFEKNFRPKRPDPFQEMQMTLEKSQVEQQSKRRKCLLGNKETPGLTQMILDAGQKEIGPKYCEECGMLYSPGDIEDEKEHQKAHSRLNNLFSIRLWKNVKIVQEFPSEGSMIVLVDCKVEPKRVLNSLKDILAWLDSELGGSCEASGSNPSEKIFLYVFRTKRKNVVRVLGCSVVEVLDRDKIRSSLVDPEAILTEKENQNTNLILGITRIWTDSAFRRKHVASRLCDSMRINCGIPGFIVPKSQIGILEPSEEGRVFMSKYTDKRGYLYSYI